MAGPWPWAAAWLLATALLARSASATTGALAAAPWQAAVHVQMSGGCAATLLDEEVEHLALLQVGHAVVEQPARSPSGLAAVDVAKEALVQRSRSSGILVQSPSPVVKPFAFGDEVFEKEIKVSDRGNLAEPVGLYVAYFSGGLVVGVAATLMALAGRSSLMRAHSSSTAGAERRDKEGPEEAAAPSPLPVTVVVDHSMESIHLFWPRVGVLVGLMLLQSLSSLIINGFHFTLVIDPALAFFLTMIVGTGGNVGSQSVVLAVRKYALAEDVQLGAELFTALRIGLLLAPLAYARCWIQSHDISVCAIVGVATLLIVLVAAWLGTAATMVLHSNRIDPAHATPMIQVLMDILGIFIVCLCAGLLQPILPS